MLRMNDCKGRDRVNHYFTACRRHFLYGKARLQEEVGGWHGELASRLGLEGPVATEDLRALGKNLWPKTGEKLTCRTAAEDRRRVLCDATFSSPKGFSLICLIMEQNELLTDFRKAHLQTMIDMERDAQVRVRKLKTPVASRMSRENRRTGNLIWADFLHHTSRPVKRKTDPGVHTHDGIINATWDPVEQKIKAAELGLIRSDAPYYEALFHSRLAGAMQGRGYRIQRQGRWWDIEGVPRDTILAFSNRSTLILEEWAKGNLSKSVAKAKLALITREEKTDETLDDLIPEWRRRLGVRAYRVLEKVISDAQGRRGTPELCVSASDAVDHAFEVSPKRPGTTLRQAMTQALWHGLGQVTPEAVHKEMQHRKGFEARHDRQPNEAWEV
jgi:conjugative relaxase-like TrwC/TraI family protein